MAEIRREFLYEIDVGDKKTVKHRVTTESDTTEAHDKMRDHICELYKLSAGEFDRYCDIIDKRIFTVFADSPWRSWEELESDLTDMETIDEISYIPPTEGTYGPPKYRVVVNSDVEMVRKEVRRYYDGLVVKENGPAVIVIVSPHEYTRSKQLS